MVGAEARPLFGMHRLNRVDVSPLRRVRPVSTECLEVAATALRPTSPRPNRDPARRLALHLVTASHAEVAPRRFGARSRTCRMGRAESRRRVKWGGHHSLTAVRQTPEVAQTCARDPRRSSSTKGTLRRLPARRHGQRPVVRPIEIQRNSHVGAETPAPGPVPADGPVRGWRRIGSSGVDRPVLRPGCPRQSPPPLRRAAPDARIIRYG